MMCRISSVMRHFHASKGVVAFLAWPVTPGNFVRIYVELFTLPHFVLSFPMKTVVSSSHFSAAIII